MDSKTQLKEITLKDMTVIYNYELKDIDLDQAKKLKELNRNFIENHACRDEKIQCLFQKDLKVRFLYRIQNKQILQVDLDKDFCLKVKRADYIA